MLDFKTAQAIWDARPKRSKYPDRVRVPNTPAWTYIKQTREGAYQLFYWYRTFDQVTEKRGSFIHIKFVPKSEEHGNEISYALIEAEKITISDKIPQNLLRKTFGIEHRRSRTIKVLGQEVFLNGVTQGVMEFPLVLSNGRVTSTKAAKVRKFDETKRKELNDLIKRVRYAVKVRYKLGAFDKFDIKDYSIEELDQSTLVAQYGLSGVWSFSDHLIAKILRAVSEDDITTFYPLMILARAYGGASRYIHQDGRYVLQVFTWLECINRYLDNTRERFRKGTGAVSYEEVS